MSAVWTLRRASGEEKTLAAWGLAECSRTLQNLDIDFCTGRMATDGPTAAVPFADGEMVSILRDGVQWFYGQVRNEAASAAGGEQARAFKIVGPGAWLEELIYRQLWTFCVWPIEFTGTLQKQLNPDNPWDLSGILPTEMDAQLSTLRDVFGYKRKTDLSSVVLLGQADDGTFIRTDESIRKVLEYAISQGAPFQVGVIDAGVKMPADEIRDMTCMQVIRRLVQWTPDQGGWWDYSTTPPTFNLRKRSAKTAEGLTLGVDAVERVDLEARRDLLLKGVTINYLRESTYSGLTLYSMERDRVGATDGLGVLYATVELSGSAMMDSNGTVFRNGAPTPEGVAQSLFDGYGVLQWQGSIPLVDDDASPLNWLSRRVNVLGGDLEWATMDGVVQTQADDVFRGRTMLQLGPPAHLSPQDFVARLQASRGLRPVPQALLDTRTDGGAATPNQPSPPSGNPPKFTFGDQKLDLVLYCHFRTNCISPWFNMGGSWCADRIRWQGPGGGELDSRGQAHGSVVSFFGLKIGIIHDNVGADGSCNPSATPCKIYDLFPSGDIVSTSVSTAGCTNC